MRWEATAYLKEKKKRGGTSANFKSVFYMLEVLYISVNSSDSHINSLRWVLL